MEHAVYEIETPENVRFHLERAGLASRALAWLLDVVMMALLLQLSALVLGPLGWFAESAASALILVAGFLIQWWYAALCEWRFAGRTCGKWIVGIAARDRGGLRLTLLQSVVRNLLRIVDLLPGLYLVGGVTALIDRHGRRLGDLAAGTIVVREARRTLPSRAASHAQPNLRLYPVLREIAGRLSPQETDAVLALAAQRDSLPLGVRLSSFEQLAEHVGRRFEFERPAHLSAENLVLYLAAALGEAAGRERSKHDALGRASTSPQES